MKTEDTVVKVAKRSGHDLVPRDWTTSEDKCESEEIRFKSSCKYKQVHYEFLGDPTESKGRLILVVDGMTEHDKEWFGHLVTLAEKKIDGTKRYGTKSWNTLGAKGLFVEINAKFHRLKAFVWDQSVKASSEHIDDTMYDLAVYCMFVIMALVREYDGEGEIHHEGAK